MNLIDTHCHLHDRSVYDYVIHQNPNLNPADYDPEKLLESAHQNDVKKIICIGTTDADSHAAAAFAAAHKNVFYSYGIHPEEADGSNVSAATIRSLENMPREGSCPSESEPPVKTGRRAGFQETLLSDANLVAIGEVGLDYHRPHDKKAQYALLEQMLSLAKTHNLPLIFHVRDAFPDFLAIVDNAHVKRAVVHSFSDTKANLEQCLKRDFYIGVNGLATFADIPLPPLERALLETDAPFLSPKSRRGKPNEPANVRYVAEFLSQKYQKSLAEVAEQTTKNAEDLFQLS